MINPMLLCDFYKISHKNMYPEKTEYVYSTFIPRNSLIPNISYVVNFGVQYFIKKYLIDVFNKEFFEKDKNEIISSYKKIISKCLNIENPETQHIEELHDLGYLPILIKALPEGSSSPIKCPVLTVVNTHPRFFWLTNYIETLISCNLWLPYTSATIASQFKNLVAYFSLITCDNQDHVQFQCHDFSMRGMSSLESAISSGMGHLLYFSGTDNIPSISALELYYNTNVNNELIGCSIPATEHSIQCAYGNDEEYFKKIITEIHPEGFVSVVCDGYDFWNFLTEILPKFKDIILNRKGKVVLRPDSGNPVKIVCGDSESNIYPIDCGAIQALWDIFGGTINSRGCKVLNEKIGLIYGDAITFERAEQILYILSSKRFAASNIVFGIGSFTYQYNTRDTFGFAMKATLTVQDGIEKPIFKNPKTDSGIKKSPRGRVAVFKNDDGGYFWCDEFKLHDEIEFDELRPVFENGNLLTDETFNTIRRR